MTDNVRRLFFACKMQKILRQKDLVAALGVQQILVTRWDNDEAMPRFKTLERLAEALSVTLQEMLAEAKGEPALPQVDDPELQLLMEVPKLQQNQRDALKTVLHDVLARCRMEAAPKA